MLRPFVLLHSSFVILVTAAAAAPGVIDYDKQVHPFLKDNCIACHNKTTTKGGLNMETPELMIKGGETDKGLIPGKGAESIIYQAAAHTWDSEMPPIRERSLIVFAIEYGITPPKSFAACLRPS